MVQYSYIPSGFLCPQVPNLANVITKHLSYAQKVFCRGAEFLFIPKVEFKEKESGSHYSNSELSEKMEALKKTFN